MRDGSKKRGKTERETKETQGNVEVVEVDGGCDREHLTLYLSHEQQQNPERGSNNQRPTLPRTIEPKGNRLSATNANRTISSPAYQAPVALAFLAVSAASERAPQRTTTAAAAPGQERPWKTGKRQHWACRPGEGKGGGWGRDDKRGKDDDEEEEAKGEGRIRNSRREIVDKTRMHEVMERKRNWRKEPRTRATRQNAMKDRKTQSRKKRTGKKGGKEQQQRVNKTPSLSHHPH